MVFSRLFSRNACANTKKTARCASSSHTPYSACNCDINSLVEPLPSNHPFVMKSCTHNTFKEFRTRDYTRVTAFGQMQCADLQCADCSARINADKTRKDAD